MTKTNQELLSAALDSADIVDELYGDTGRHGTYELLEALESLTEILTECRVCEVQARLFADSGLCWECADTHYHDS